MNDSGAPFLRPDQEAASTETQPQKGFLIWWIAAGAVLVLLVGGGFLIMGKSATGVVDTQVTWGTYGSGRLSDVNALQGSSVEAPGLNRRFTAEEIYTQIAAERTGDIAFVPTNVYEKNAALTVDTKAEDGEYLFKDQDIEALFASLGRSAQPVAPRNSFGDELSIDDILSYVPVVVGGISGEARLSEKQEKLYLYANEAGSYIEIHGEAWHDQAQVLQRFMEDRENPLKSGEAEELAEALGGLGNALASIDADLIPLEVAAPHQQLVERYRELGDALQVVVQARTDEDMLPAILAYNESAEKFARAYLAIVTVMSVAEVTFSSADPGKVFSFQPTPQL